MKTLIIKTIAKNFRKKLPIARNLKVQHINYMYEYNYIKLFKTLIDSLTLEPQHFNNRFIK
jgi:hypothetical protein